MQMRVPVLLLVLLLAGCAAPSGRSDEDASDPSTSANPSRQGAAFAADPQGLRVFAIQGLLSVDGIGPQHFGTESCDAALAWSVDFNQKSITQLRSFGQVPGNASLVLVGEVVMLYREGTSTCYGDAILMGTEAGTLDPENGESGPLGLVVQAGPDQGVWTLGGESLEAGAVASALIDRPGLHGLVHVTDLGVWNRSALRSVDELHDLPGPSLRWSMDNLGRANVVHDVWPDGAPDGTYRHLRVTGSLRESGPAYPPSRVACTPAPRVFHEDVPAKEAWLMPRLWAWDDAEWNAVPLRATMLAVDEVDVAYLDGHGQGCSGVRAQATSGMLLGLRRADDDPWLRIELAADQLSVSGRPLPAGGTVTVPISFTRSVDHGDGPATYTYAGDVTVTDDGAWPRAGLHVELHGWAESPARHV